MGVACARWGESSVLIVTFERNAVGGSGGHKLWCGDTPLAGGGFHGAPVWRVMMTKRMRFGAFSSSSRVKEMYCRSEYRALPTWAMGGRRMSDSAFLVSEEVDP